MATASIASPPTASTPSPAAGAWVLGFALGGFVDGILLHQVLQWHHLLSLVPGEALRDIRAQILADGAFHVGMYAIAAVGLWMLWRRRGGFSGTGADRRVAAGAAFGFALWQAADTVLFHWLLGIHRIRVDVPNPLLWDIGWVVMFGVPPLLLGLWLRAHADRGGPGNGRVAAALSAIALLAAPIAALPPGGDAPVLVLFREGIGAPGAFAAVAAIDARVVWADPSGELLAIVPGDRSPYRLIGHGALLVGGSPAVAGCLAWSRI
ncbi:DUF2243 domain-containing protein [Salinarimonas soli]|uniref:DUF2243 domain-containing protein n=1 Tax=Salinarimonas soli TaxID=1638099 RepID=A0A5B2VI72_9HYPH|nr:DUF2243 domain-containing protein [Salinarimonas soli]KAA2238029.1 DUF2243 domain-containing protein [Salinarimonas soli]